MPKANFSFLQFKFLTKSLLFLSLWCGLSSAQVYITTGQTGANGKLPGSWTVTPGAGIAASFNFGGGYFNMEVNNGYTYTLNVRATNASGTLLGTRQRTAAQLCPSACPGYNNQIFTLPSALTFSSPNSYYVELVGLDPSSQPDTSTNLKSNAASFVNSGGTVINLAATTAPGAPTIGAATAGNGTATVSFTAPVSTGGSAITGYTATCSPGGATASGSSSPITVTGLTNGTAYTCTVTATNVVGTSAASSASNSVTPLGTQSITWSPATVVTTTQSPLTFAAATTSPGGGAITYAVTSAGTTNCAIATSTIPTVTYNATGSCQITATAAANATYSQDTSALTFVVGVGTQNITWSPTTAVTLGQSPLTFAAATTPHGGRAITYAVTSAGTTNCAIASPSSPRFTYSATGSCQITATAAANATYAQATSAVTFVVGLIPQTLIWTPKTTLTTDQSNLALAAATGTGSGAVTYAVVGVGAGTGCAISGGNRLSFIRTGICTLTATIAADATYAADTNVKIFTIEDPRTLSLNVNPQSVNVTFQQGKAFTGGTQNLFVTEAGTAPFAMWTASVAPAVAWLSIAKATGDSSTPQVVTLNPTGLAPGVYTTSITFSVSASSVTVDPVTVPVTFTVLAPAAISMSATAITVLSNQDLKTPSVFPLTINPSGISWTLEQATPAQSWLTIGSASGVGPSTVNLTLNPAKLSNGSYWASLVLTSPGAPNSPLTIRVQFVVGDQIISVAPLVNAASFAAWSSSAVAPNEVVALFLPGVSCPATPTVALNGVALAVLFFGSGQLNLVMPETVTPGTLTVSCTGSPTWSFYGLAVVPSMPGLFTVTFTGIGPGAIVNQDGTGNSMLNPAKSGSYVSVYGTGFGAYNAALADGLRRLTATVTATIGGVPATVHYAGSSPGSTLGLSQINVQVPTDVTTGPMALIVLTVNGVSTQTGVTIAIQ